MIDARVVYGLSRFDTREVYGRSASPAGASTDPLIQHSLGLCAYTYLIAKCQCSIPEWCMVSARVVYGVQAPISVCFQSGVWPVSV